MTPDFSKFSFDGVVLMLPSDTAVSGSETGNARSRQKRMLLSWFRRNFAARRDFSFRRRARCSLGLKATDPASSTLSAPTLQTPRLLFRRKVIKLEAGLFRRPSVEALLPSDPMNTDPEEGDEE